jgi:Concanavalin A-like lectin/glucanases superfamily/Right handed beta helix region
MKTRLLSSIGLPALLACAGPLLRAADGSLAFAPGSAQRVEVPNFQGLGITTEVTVEFDALSTSNSLAQAVFILNPDTVNNRFQGTFNSLGGTTWDFGDTGDGGRISLTNVPAWLNQWTHFAFVASQSGGFMNIYANGVQVASVNTFNVLESTGAAVLRIGGGSGSYFQGKIDEFRIWNTARSEAQIQAQRGGPLTGSEPGLRLYFKFDEGTGTTAVNSATATGAAFNGTLQGSPVPVWSPPARTAYPVTSMAGAGPGSLAQALVEAAEASGPALITFPAALNGGTISLTDPDADGTAIAIHDAGGVTLDASSLPGGLTLNAGGATGFRLFSTARGSSLVLRGLRLANSGGESEGGAVRNFGTLSLTQCTLTGNSATGGGGALSNHGGNLTLDGCTLDGNTAIGDGGAIYQNAGQLIVTRCTFTGNTADFGGAISGHGSQSITHCTLTGNSAGYGNAVFNTGTLTLTGCTFAGNHTGFGGAACNTGVLSLTHCTLAGNSTGGCGGALFNEGNLSLTHCTVSANSAEYGGALYNNSPLTLTNTILADNAATGNGADLYHTGTGSRTRTGSNLLRTVFSDGTGTETGPAAIAAPPLLAPLDDYGGPTKTMALLPGSPARNAASSSPIASDQRLFPIIGPPDIGAYEAGSLATNFNAFIYETLPAGTTPADHAASFDFDKDDRTNFDEFQYLTNAASASSFFQPTSVLDSAGLLIAFPSATGRTYRLRQSDNLTTWTDAPVALITGDGNTRTFSINTTNVPRRFFMILPILP